MCADEGIWSGEAPKCLFDWCPEPPPVTGAIVTVDGHKAGSLATYTCQNGFILFGPPVSDSKQNISAYPFEFQFTEFTVTCKHNFEIYIANVVRILVTKPQYFVPVPENLLFPNHDPDRSQ